MASHSTPWDANILQAKLMVLVLAGVLMGLHVVSRSSRALAYGIGGASLVVLWLGVKLTYG